MAAYNLIVTQSFGKYEIGAHVTDDAEIEAITSDRHRMHSYVRVPVEAHEALKPADAPVEAAPSAPAASSFDA